MAPRTVAPTERSEELDRRLERFASVCDELVDGPQARLDDVRREVEHLVEAIVAHVGSSDPLAAAPKAARPPATSVEVRLRSEHERFRVSVVQLGWFLGIVERDDHGGNRQALGQYGRLVVEALRRHRADEQPSAEVLPEGGMGELPASSGNPK